MDTHTDHVHTLQKSQYDPTRTLTLRNKFSDKFSARLKELRSVLRETIVERDCFGLISPAVQQANFSPSGRGEFAYPNDNEKIAYFLAWLKEQLQAGIIDRSGFVKITRETWTNLYLRRAYERGVRQARQELKKLGMEIPDVDEIDALLSAEPHKSNLADLHQRMINELEGFTSDISHRIGRVLSDSFSKGHSPYMILERINKGLIQGKDRKELGLTLLFGKFVAFEMRADMIARTEIVRDVAEAGLVEYDHWGIEEVGLMAEWVTAGDNRVCVRCQAMSAQGPYKLSEAKGMIPAHIYCFVDHQIPIYTSEGWKKIANVNKEDYVLTHKGRFKKVIDTIRIPKQTVEVTRIKFEGKSHISMTSNHPVLIETNKGHKWMRAGDCVEGTKIINLANRCKRCGKLIPNFKKYCSRSCISKDITDWQWKDEQHRKNMSKKTTEQLKKEYSQGIRDKDKITKKANEKVRKMVEDGNWHQSEKQIQKLINAARKKENREASSKRMKENNPMHDPEIVQKAQISIEKYYRQNPERRINARMAKHRKSGKMTSIEKKMSILLDQIGINYVFQYPILRYNVDFAIPALKIVIECDGEYWHQDEEYDKKRQKRIEDEGWFVLRYTDSKINECLDDIRKELYRVLCNHEGKYKFIGWPIQRIEKYTTKKPKTLYNLSVEDDESYIAKGYVVHNCRCWWLPVRKKTRKE